jgi:hypothetical protein
MRSLNVYFEDSEHDFLLAEKGGASWRDFILRLARDEALRREAAKVPAT